MPIEASLAITYIPLFILYIGLIAWLTYDASQDSNWVVWLLLFILAGPLTIPFYFVASRIARRGTSQDVLDRRADEKRETGQAFKFASDIDKMKWVQNLDPAKGTVFEPTLGLSLRQDRHDHFVDERADWLLAQGDEAEAFDYLTGMYAIATEQADAERTVGYKRLIETRLRNGPARLAHWITTGEDLTEEPEEPSKPTSVEPPGKPERSVPF